MKCGKKIFSLIMAIAITTNIFIFSDIQVLAHESILDIEYDDSSKRYNRIGRRRC
jgi:hypothetical protein